MLNHSKILLLLILLTPFLSIAQVGGKGTYQFMNLVSSARQTALGSKIISAKDDDVNFAIFNPALINKGMDGKVSFNYVDYFTDINYGSFAYGRDFDRLGTFVASVTYVNYGEFIKSEHGEELGTFSANEMALNIGYSYSIDSLWTVGSNAKIINSVLDNWNSYGMALDFGVTFKVPKKNIMFALVMKNIGMQFKTYSGQDRENLPFEIQLGMSQELEHLPLQWSITLDNLQQLDVSYSNPSATTIDGNGNEQIEEVSFLNKAMRHVTIGAELFPRRNFSARLGYNFRRAAEMELVDKKNFGGFSFGFGMKIKKFRISYGRAVYSPAGGTNNFSVITDLNTF
jgi:hypothetical protein